MERYNRTDELYRDFVQSFPLMSRRVIDWYRSGRWEITVILEDRDTVIFNGYAGTIRSVNRKTAEDLDQTPFMEEVWRDEFRRTFAKWVEASGLTYSEISDLTGVSKNSLSNYANGRSTPSAYAVYRIARVLGCSSSEFIDFDI